MERLQYKIKNGPRVESVNEFTLNDNTIVAMFQGFRGSYPELDFIVKYLIIQVKYQKYILQMKILNKFLKLPIY